MSGFAVFVVAHLLEPAVQPLLACMVAGFIITNYSEKRVCFEAVQVDLASSVYASFFTLTGAALSMHSLSSNIWVAFVLCFCRAVGIAIGTQAGFRAAQDPDVHVWVSWMAFITQAGITLAIAKQVQLEHLWGCAFATVIVTVFVLNQLIGPWMFRLALRVVGESRSSPTLFRLHYRQRQLF